jgi:non-heme chloroperoxidase
VADPRTVRFRIAERLTIAGDAFGDPGAPPVVLLHGGGQTRHAWGGTAAALAEHGWHALALDLRGHGDSDWAPDHDYRIDAFANDLRAVAAALGRPVVVVGASLGGMAGLLAAGEPPPMDAAAVVLVDIVPRIEPAGVQRIIAFMTANPDGFASLDEAADAVAGYLHHRPRPRDLDGLRKNLRLGADGRYRWHWDPHMMAGERRVNASRSPERLEHAAAALRAPLLLVRGRMSDVVSEEGARALLAVVPSACYVDVSGAGHMVAGDRNDRFTKAVVTFLSDAIGRAG